MCKLGPCYGWLAMLASIISMWVFASDRFFSDSQSWSSDPCHMLHARLQAPPSQIPLHLGWLQCMMTQPMLPLATSPAATAPTCSWAWVCHGSSPAATTMAGCVFFFRVSCSFWPALASHHHHCNYSCTITTQTVCPCLALFASLN